MDTTKELLKESKKMKTFKLRTWLNKKDSPNTGSLVIYDGESPWKQGKKKDNLCFIEFADCHGKIRLHKTDLDSSKDWIKKIEKIIESLELYVIWLKKIDGTNEV